MGVVDPNAAVNRLSAPLRKHHRAQGDEHRDSEDQCASKHRKLPRFPLHRLPALGISKTRAASASFGIDQIKRSARQAITYPFHKIQAFYSMNIKLYETIILEE
jgi:hypothetical protein